MKVRPCHYFDITAIYLVHFINDVAINCFIWLLRCMWNHALIVLLNVITLSRGVSWKLKLKDKSDDWLRFEVVRF